MKHLRKIISLILVAVIIVTVSACGKDTEDSTATTKKATTANGNNNTTTSPEESTTSITEPTETQSSTESNVTEAPTQTPTQAPTKAPETTEAVTEAPTPTPTGVKSVIYEKNGNVEKQIVYYPAELETKSKTYPIVSWANGTMCTPDIYTDLLKDIAEGGYIVIASYETMTADGTAQIASIDLMISENSNSSSIFYKKVDTGRIALIGHSQGGRSSVNAAAIDSRIDCLISIAGSNFDYEAEKNNVPSLFLSGSNDYIVSKDQWVLPAYELAKGPAVYACLDGAIHTTCCSDPAKYSGYINSWLKSWLYNDTTAKAIFKDGGAFSKDSAWTGFESKGI